MFSISLCLLLLSLTCNALSIYIYSNTPLSAVYITAVVLGLIATVLIVVLHNSNPGDIQSTNHDKEAYLRLLS